jgi:hypothetical protein
MLDDVNISTSVTDKVKRQYESIKSRLIKEDKANIIASHHGIVSQDLINSLADTIEDILLSYGEDKTKIKRIFSIFIEGCRNIRSHGSLDENNRQTAFFLVVRSQGTYRIYFSNLIANEDVERVESYVSDLNNTNLDDIKSMHQSSLLNYVQNQKDGSGSGLLIMRMRSFNRLDTFFTNLNEQLSLFTVQVNVLN